ncbi:sensor histidine kinase [Flexivirga sp. ID2601S]|uniref:histidine kinase n=1 Tax=Flexivirga aerilata TaxID=1656889 RepID=A0A849AKB6_9MICO|nr:sensor histidine kinase [Flexivirga aerilata]NNG38840.1 sensor histidine kinase [Flexivirga aerilata]
MIRATGRDQRARRVPFTRQMVLLQVAVVAALGLGSLLVAGFFLRSTLSTQYEQRALAVARAVASDPGLADAVVREDQPRVQQMAMAQQKSTHALFVVVTDDRGIRLAHPDSDEIGKMVSTNPREALAGRENTSIDRGTLGLSARGKVPLRDDTGRVVGEVSVGFAASEVGHALRKALFVTAPWTLLALLVAVLLTTMLGRRLKRLTLGLEPSEVADLVREREAVLHGISEGVLAVDTRRRVTMCNAEAKRLLDKQIVVGMTLDDLELPAGLSRSLSAPSHGDSELVTAVSGSRVLVAKHRPVQLEDGTDLGAVLTVQDRTELEQLTSELAAVRNLTGALRAQRHEFANRMHTVMGLLHTRAVDDAIEYLSDSAKFATTDQSENSSAVQSNTIRAFFAGKQSYAAESGVRLTLSEETWVPRKLVAPVEVITVLGNLVDNAIEAARTSAARPAVVEVDLLADGRTLVMSVANTGDGISEERAAAIFVEGVSSRGTGRGMGLAIACRTAEALGGQLRLTARGDDNGETVFVAHLPGVLADEDLREGQ